jgi:TP901 family phage tail tape measure protein
MIQGGISKVTVEIGGKVAASLAASVRSAQMQVSSFGRNVSRTMNDAATASRKSFKNVFDSALWQQATIGATAFAGAIGLSVKAAIEFDKSMADVKKAIDFKEGEQGLKRFGNQLIKLSTELPYTAAQLSQIAASAGFAGYAEDEIIPFTRAAARMGVAFQMTAEQAGDAMVALRASMGLTQPQVESLGDAINYLSDKFQGTVNAADLTEVTRRIGAIGKAAGLTSEQVAGMGAAFLASGTPAEVAATGLKNFLNALTKGQQATQSQSFALATLFSGDGMAEAIKSGKGGARKEAKKAAIEISEELAKGMQTAPEATIKSVLERMAKLPKEQQVSIAGALFGEESKSAIMPLLTNLKLVDQAFDLVREKSAFAGSMQKEFANQMGTASAQATIFRNGVNALGISIGTAILPSLNAIMKAIGPVLVRFAEFAQQNQGLVTGIVLVGGALAGLVIALPVIAGVITAIGTLKTAFIAAKAAAVAMNVGGLIAGWLPRIASLGIAFGTAMLPLLPWIALIAGIGVGIYLLVKNWDKVKAAAGRAWQGIVEKWGQFTEWIGGMFNQALAVIRAWAPKVLGVMFPIPAAIIRMFQEGGIGQRIITGIIDGLKAKASGLFGWVRGAWDRIRGIVGGGDSAPAPAAPSLPVTPPGRANGGTVRAGNPYVVGERRRELFVPGMDGAIIPKVARPVTAAALASLMAAPAAAAVIAPQAPAVPAPQAAARSITVHAPVTIHAAGGDAQGIRDQVRLAFADIQRELEAAHRTLLSD